MIDLIEKLNFESELKNKLISLARKDKAKIDLLAQKCRNGDFSCLNRKNDLMKLAVTLKTAEYTKLKYQSLGIPEKIFFDTMGDIEIWCENNGNRGLKNIDWIKNHLNCELFRLGRLQFQFFKCNSRLIDYSLFPFDYGEDVIFIHIPQGEKLIYSDCLASVRQAVEFFDEYFPDYNFRYFFCESWLLYGENYQFMDASSNIMQFSSMFDIPVSKPIQFQAIERIFGKRKVNKKNYPENTTLQKNAKEFILGGNKLGIGIGYIDKLEFMS